jgi:hypothetical protein
VSTIAIRGQVFKSDDKMATWDAGKDIGAIQLNAKGEVAYTYVGVRDDVDVHFKVGAFNAAGSAIREWSGIWWDTRKMPLSSPPGAGAN